MHLEDLDVLLSRPLNLPDSGVQMIVPPAQIEIC